MDFDIAYALGRSGKALIKTSVATDQHPFELVLSQTALLVIDMQIDFCDRAGFCSVNLRASAIRKMIPRLQRLV
jgi:hypothetical protein